MMHFVWIRGAHRRLEPQIWDEMALEWGLGKKETDPTLLTSHPISVAEKHLSIDELVKRYPAPQTHEEE